MFYWHFYGIAIKASSEVGLVGESGRDGVLDCQLGGRIDAHGVGDRHLEFFLVREVVVVLSRKIDVLLVHVGLDSFGCRCFFLPKGL